MHHAEHRVYVYLVTFRKSERDFSASTNDDDQPISPTLLHWESQSTVARRHKAAKHYFQFQDLGYTILLFARMTKGQGMLTAPFAFVGPASRLIQCEGERSLRMTWELERAMPAELFEQARLGG
jgi:hypothetical protein